MEPKGKQPTQLAQNTVRMGMGKLTELFDEMERNSPSGKQDPRRLHVRWPFRAEAVPLKIMHIGAPPVTILVACRNISSEGMSVLHNSFFYTGTRVVMGLPHVSGHVLEVEGTVVRCLHVRGVCHELGIKFKAAVDAQNFVEINPIDGDFDLEKVDPESIDGTIVVVEDSKAGHEAIAKYLGDTRTRLRAATTFAEARPLIDGKVNAILCDAVVHGQEATEFVASLRKQGITTPVIVMSSDSSEAARGKFLVADANAVLVKPVSQPMILRALSEYLSARKDVGEQFSNLPPNHPNVPMLEQFVQDVRAQAGELELAIQAKDLTRSRTVVLQVAGVAPTMGFQKLARLAQNADRVLSTATSLDDAKLQLAMLLKSCRQVRLAAAA